MQRMIAAASARVAPPIAIASSTASTSTRIAVAQETHAEHPQVRSPTSSDDGGWSMIGDFNANPVEITEVQEALLTLSTVAAADDALSPRVSLPRSLSDSDIQLEQNNNEVEEDEDSITNGSAADRMMLLAEQPLVFGVDQGNNGNNNQEDVDNNPMNAIASAVSNLLNDPVVGPAIVDRLSQDVSICRLIDQYAPMRTIGLPEQEQQRQAFPLGIPMLPPRMPRHQQRQQQRRRRPVIDVHKEALGALVEGVVGAVQNIVKAVCAFGGALRCLPGDLKLLFSSMTKNVELHMSPVEAESHRHHIRNALIRVATSVAVAVLARRMILRRI